MAQLLQARFDRFRYANANTIIHKNNIHTLILDCAELDARASSFYEYARSNGRVNPKKFTDYMSYSIWQVSEAFVGLDEIEKLSHSRIASGFYTDRFKPEENA